MSAHRKDWRGTNGKVIAIGDKWTFAFCKMAMNTPVRIIGLGFGQHRKVGH